MLIYKSSYGRCSVKKVFLEISQNSQETTCVMSLFFSGLQLYLKKDSGTGVFLRTTFLQNTSGRLLLNLAGSRNFLSYITMQGTNNFYSMCHCGVQDLQSIFSFRSNKCEILSPFVKEIKVKHPPFKTLSYNGVSGLIRYSASTV